jgi:hypothetical protein
MSEAYNGLVTQSQAELSDKHEYENQLSRPAKKRRANPSRQVQRSSHGPKMTGFNGPNLESSEFEKLRDSTARLQEENTALRLQISASQTPAWTTLYRVDCGRKNNLTTYSAAPILCGDKNDGHFQGQTPAEDVEPFIARQKERLPFLVLQNYRCCGHKSDNNSGEGLNRTNRNMHLGSSRTVEEIYLLSKELCKALGEVTKLCPHGDNYYPSFEVGKLIKGPYFWYYHNRGELDRAALSLTVEGETEFRLFQKCISQNLGGEYDIVDSMLSRRKITTRFFNYLYNPGTVLLTEESDAIAAFMQDDWPETTAWEFELQEGKHHDIENELKIKAWHWSFDGVFQRTDTFLKIPFNANASADGYFDVDKEIDFTSLSSYPLAYAGRDVEKRLFERGTKFWSCRHRNYVAYNGGRYKTGQINVSMNLSRKRSAFINALQTESRFMVDLATFYMMHPKKLPKCRLTDHLGPDATAREQPPGGNFLLLLPDKVHGFDMQEKQWGELHLGMCGT